MSYTGTEHRLTVVFQVLNKTKEFEEAVKKVIKDVNLDNDIVVSVFETNIRVLGWVTFVFKTPKNVDFSQYL